MNWRERIESDPQAPHGKPRVRGTRIPVAVVLDNLAAHVDLQEVLASYPVLSVDDVRACVAYAAECSREQPGAVHGAVPVPAEPAAEQVPAEPPARPARRRTPG